MIGYHYTSWDNWLSIEQRGLHPYDLKKREITEALERDGLIRGPVYAIFTWKRAQSGRELAGSIMFHALGKTCTRVVELKLTYAHDDRIWRCNGGAVDLFHDMDDRGPGHCFWHRQVPAFLLKNPVPPKRIRLLRVFDLTKCERLAVKR